MKKLALTFAIVLGLSMTTFANPNGGGLFQRGTTDETINREGGSLASPGLPGHGEDDDQDGNQTPLGSGIAVLMGLGAAYLVGKKRNEK